MGQTVRDYTTCRVLWVSDANVLDDTAAAADRELLRALVRLGMPCEAVCRFTVAGEKETEPGPWLEGRGWKTEDTRFAASTGAVLRVDAGGIPVRIVCGPTTRPHAPEEEERGAFLRAVEDDLRRYRPAVVAVRTGPTAAAVLAAARAAGAATVAVQPDCSPHDPAAFRDADLVLTPSRFAAEFLRAAFDLPCAHLPPVVAGGPPTGAPPATGAVVFDASAPGSGLSAFAQIAVELHRRRPDIPFVVIGGDGSAALPGGGSVRCVPADAAGGAWDAARVCLAPTAGWEFPPFGALSALARGVPVVASDRGAAPEWLDGAGPLLPLPDALTAATATTLAPADLGRWVDAVLRLYDTPEHFARQREAAARLGRQWAAAELAPRYARLLAGLAARRYHAAPGANGSANGRADSAADVRRLADARPWPDQRPDDAAPGREPGWLGAGTETMLARVLTPKTRLVVELGAWLGLSTRFIADAAPHATVVSVDHWEGSAEHRSQGQYADLLPRLFETFQARCWEYRDRVVPLRMNSLDGLRTVAEHGLSPDLVYVDAEHSYEAVSAELALARELFPSATLCGDDFDWTGVRSAVTEFAGRHGMVVDRFGTRGWRLLEGWMAADASHPPPARGQWVALVPHLNGIEWECEQALRRLEQAGVRVVRRGGCSAIDVARNELVSDALHDGAEAMLFIDSDIGFEPADALRLFARPEPVVSGVYPKKGMRELASTFADGTKAVMFGPEAAGPYPLKYAATGFLRLRSSVLRRMADELKLPLCNTHWGRGVWPFFQPLIVPQGPEKWHYLAEDWAFSYRLARLGVTALADTSIRLWHWGRYGFGWEDAGSTVQRYRTYTYNLTGAG